MWRRIAWRKWSSARASHRKLDTRRSLLGYRKNSSLPCCLQSIGLLHQSIREIVRHFDCFFFLQPVVRDQLRQESAIHTPRHIMAARNREEGPGVVVETHCIVEARRLRDAFAETGHSFRTIVKPPRGPKAQAWIMSSQRSQFTAVGRLIKCEKNDPQIALIPIQIQQWPERA